MLILGESGTGKETVAEQIHAHSPRKNFGFVAFNCASVAKDLLEDRFFGHEKGAFTGADRQTKGLFERADHGTLFLDDPSTSGSWSQPTGICRRWCARGSSGRISTSGFRPSS